MMLSTLADDAITLHYQPVSETRGKIVGFEALMRWHHQQRGLISPEAFIPVFENCGLIVQLSQWSLKQACVDAVAWKRPLQVSVNISPLQFQQDDLPELVAAVLDETGLAPERLELEVTEAALNADPVQTGLALSRLTAHGIAIAIDDAAGGVELPFFLRDYPISRVKIARNVVQIVETSKSARSIIHMILLVGRSMNVPVAAKGVETTGQLAFLAEQGCDFMQGFMVGRPAEIASFSSLTGNTPADFGTPPIPIPAPFLSRLNAVASEVRVQ